MHRILVFSYRLCVSPLALGISFAGARHLNAAEATPIVKTAIVKTTATRGASAPNATNGGRFTYQITSFAATPASISFTANNPDAGTVAIGATSVITWVGEDCLNNQTWKVTVKASASTLTNCSTVPISAVTVATCSSSVTQGGTATCHTPLTVTTSEQTLVNGLEGQVSTGSTCTGTTNITYTLNESWRYIAATSPTCFACCPACK